MTTVTTSTTAEKITRILVRQGRTTRGSQARRGTLDTSKTSA